jgi:NADPH2:quinone reductase
VQHTTDSAKAVRIHATGGPEALVFENLALDEPGPGQVRIRQTAVGLNFIDTYHRSGLYPLPSLPHGIGMEAAGVIDRIGKNVTDLKVGQRVAYASGPPGAYAESRVVASDRVVVLPDTIDERTGAAILLKGLTAEYLIRRTFRVEPGMFVLFHAAAGGVGLIACQWLSHLGATVIGTVGSDAKAVLALANGCQHT